MARPVPSATQFSAFSATWQGTPGETFRPPKIEAWGAGAATPGFAVGGGKTRIETKIDPGAGLKWWSQQSFKDAQVHQYKADFHRANLDRMGFGTTTSPAKGVQIRQAYLDKGDWPANPFGLFYPAAARPVPASPNPHAQAVPALGQGEHP